MSPIDVERLFDFELAPDEPSSEPAHLSGEASFRQQSEEEAPVGPV
jgi:hypothetical protein